MYLNLQEKKKLEKYARSIGIEKYKKDYFSKLVIPIATQIFQKHKNIKGTIKIYISGGQGSGKSVLSKFLKYFLVNRFNIKVADFSIDDLYLSKNSRIKLSKKVHPLLITRGVPGTHNVSNGIKIIKRLISNKHETIIPVFSKLDDEIAPRKLWRKFYGIPDVILFDGWCVGAEAQKEKHWREPINSLEKRFDKDGKWSKWVNKQLLGEYNQLFNMFDSSIYILVKNFKKIIKNRWEQEITNKNIDRKSQKSGFNNVDEIKNFAMHFERITLEMTDYMPKKSDVVIKREGKKNFIVVKNQIMRY